MQHTFFPSRSRNLAAWLRVTLSLALGLLLVWVLAPGIASVWAGTPFEATAAAFLLAFVLFAPLSLLSHIIVFLVSGEAKETSTKNPQKTNNSKDRLS